MSGADDFEVPEGLEPLRDFVFQLEARRKNARARATEARHILPRLSEIVAKTPVAVGELGNEKIAEGEMNPVQANAFARGWTGACREMRAQLESTRNSILSEMAGELAVEAYISNELLPLALRLIDAMNEVEEGPATIAPVDSFGPED